MLRAADQARAQACVAQRRPAELVARPGPGVEPVANRQRRHARCGRREACAPRRLQGVHIHCLARFGRRVRAVPAPAPAGLTHPNPVGRAHARPGVFGLVDERLQQPGAVAVETREVVADRAGGPAQQVRGQIAAPDAGAHQQPAQSQHPVQVGAPANIVPPDPGVAGPQVPRTRREPDTAQPTMRRAHQIAQLRADKRTGATRVLVCHQRVPDPALLVGLHQHPRQVLNRADRVRYVYCRRHRVREHTRAAYTAAGAPTSRQRHVAGRLQVGQRRAAARALPPAAPITEIERFTNVVGDLPEAANALRHRPVQHVAQSGEVAPQAAYDLILNLHTGHRSEVASLSPAKSCGARAALATDPEDERRDRQERAQQGEPDSDHPAQRADLTLEGLGRRGRGIESDEVAAERGRVDAVIAGLLFMAGMRRSEVSALRWSDVVDTTDGDGVLVRVRISKTNQEGEVNDVRFVKAGVARAIRMLRAATSSEPADRVVPLSAQMIGLRFTAAAQAAGVERRVTAHSGRVGLASELTSRGASTTDVMLAGNWKTSRMVAHYSAGATAERGAVARYL